MRRPGSMWSLENLGRVRLSKYFYMRDFLYSEIGNFHRVQNLPRGPSFDRGREGLLPSPPSEPDLRFSRIRLSGWWFPHRGRLAACQAG